MDWKGKLGVLVAVGIVLAALVGTLVVDRPTIESVDNDWGTVTSNETEVETHIVIENPPLLELGDTVADVEYTVTLNDVQVASEQKDGVDLAGRRGAVNLSTWMNNDDVPEWWVSHVENDETTTVRVDPDVVVESTGRGVSAESWSRERTFQTDLLASLETTESRAFEVRDRKVFVIEETSAQWGNVTRARTPSTISMTVSNRLPIPLPVREVNYTIRMNGVVVGNGTALSDRTLAANSTQQLEARTVIDNSKLDEWWVTHVHNNETTRVSVDFNASVSYRGQSYRLPAEFVANETFQTDIFPEDDESNDARRTSVSEGLAKSTATTGFRSPRPTAGSKKHISGHPRVSTHPSLL